MLGESPVWDVANGTLYWVDQMRETVRSFQPASGASRDWPVPQIPGSVALAQEGQLLLALADGFHLLDLTSSACTAFAAVQHGGPGVRMNDGRSDRSGRYVGGSIVFGRAEPDGCLYRLNEDGRVEVLQRGIVVANSVCFNAAGDRLYYADSRAGTILVCDYDPNGSEVGEPRVFADTRPHGSVPDGATVDADGCVWVALIENGRVLRLRPDGALDRTLQLPVPYVTSVCFGGPAMDVLYVTSVSDTGMRLRTDHPDAGTLFAVTGLGVKGVPEGRFKMRER